MIKTKIIATLGPSTETEEAIERLMAAGVDVFRMNFSHGELAWHEKVLERINRVRGRHRHTAAVLGDLCGPKIRTGKIEAGNLLVNQEVVIWGDERAGTALEFGTNYPELVADAVVGERLLINDGEIALRVKAKEPDRLVCVVERGGPISSGKGINLPDTKVSAPSITPQDWRCAEWAIKHKVDYLALSFVRSASDVLALRQRVRETGSEIKVVAKIEKPEAVADLQAILHASDAVMVARGDLGVEMDLAEVPLIQKRITSMGRRLGKPVIVATQMLQSMIANATPTRAEVNDVANAILDFADAVMLSGETAVGRYPELAVGTIRRVAQVTERYLDEGNETRPAMESEAELLTTAAMARSVAQIVDDTGAKLVAVWSQTGAAARFLSKARIDVPIVALTSDKVVSQQMALHYGVVPRTEPLPENVGQMVILVEQLLLKNKWAQVADRIVMVAGRPVVQGGTTNAVLVHTITGDSN